MTTDHEALVKRLREYADVLDETFPMNDTAALLDEAADALAAQGGEQSASTERMPPAPPYFRIMSEVLAGNEDVKSFNCNADNLRELMAYIDALKKFASMKPRTSPTKGKLCKSCAEEAARILGRLDLDMQDGKCDPTPADCAEAILEAAEKEGK